MAAQSVVCALNAAAKNGTIVAMNKRISTATATALVLLMTPGLSFFYGGMVQRKNVLSTFMHCFFALGLVTLQWAVYGLIALHAGAALRHHFVLRDGVLRRMLPGRQAPAE